MKCAIIPGTVKLKKAPKVTRHFPCCFHLCGNHCEPGPLGVRKSLQQPVKPVGVWCGLMIMDVSVSVRAPQVCSSVCMCMSLHSLVSDRQPLPFLAFNPAVYPAGTQLYKCKSKHLIMKGDIGVDWRMYIHTQFGKILVLCVLEYWYAAWKMLASACV